MPERAVLAKEQTNGRLRAMRVPRFFSWSLFLTLGLTSCGRTGAVPPPPPAPVPAPEKPGAGPPMSGAAAATPPPPTDVSEPPADAEREPSGVARKILARGTGTVHPDLRAYVDLRYTGWERNGRQFEGTSSDGSPRRFEMKELAIGLQQELEHMVEGERRRIWLPSALAYGKRLS